MKKLFFAFVAVTAIVLSACNNKPKDAVESAAATVDTAAAAVTTAAAAVDTAAAAVTNTVDSVAK